MNLIQRILNRAATAAPVAANPLPPSPSTNNVPLQPAPNAPRADCDAWEAKHSTDPYFPAGRLLKSGLHFNGPRPVVTEKLCAAVLKMAGGVDIVSAAGRAELRECIELKKANDKAMEQASFFNINVLIRNSSAQADWSKIDVGQLPNVMNHRQAQDTILAVRTALHEKNAQISQRVYAVLLPVCHKFRDAARAMVEEQDKKERAGHASLYGADEPFAPSQLLRCLAYVALQHWSTPIRNFILARQCMPPSNPNDLLELWFNRPQAKPVLPLRPPSQRRDIAAENLALVTADRAKAREEKNKLVETIKKTSAKASEDKQNIIAARSVEMDVRKAAVMEKMSNGTGGTANV